MSSTGLPSNKENTACTNFLLKLSMTVETDHLPSTVSSTCEVDLLSSQVVQTGADPGFFLGGGAPLTD